MSKEGSFYSQAQYCQANLNPIAKQVASFLLSSTLCFARFTIVNRSSWLRVINANCFEGSSPNGVTQIAYSGDFMAVVCGIGQSC